ncbi:SDR family oxidoreductase [soil metagenome]
MKLIVFGATGSIGRQVVPQALAAGHHVTAVVRRPAALTIQHKNLTIVRGDGLEPATFASSITGQDAVLSSLGVHDRKPTTVYSAGIANIIQVMQSAGVRRLLCISASGLNPGPRWQRWFAKPILWWILRESYSDLVRMEAVVRASQLDWTIIRPPRLIDGLRTGHYQIATNQQLSHGSKIRRADVADYMLTHLEDRGAYRALVEIAA